MDLASRARIAKPENLSRIMEYGRKAHENKANGQSDLFASETSSLPPLELEEAEPWTEMQALEEERKAVGFYLSGHPLKREHAIIALVNWLNEMKRQNNAKYGSHLLNRPMQTTKGGRRNGYKSR